MAMTSVKYLGIWMDHANAHLMDCTAGMDAITTSSASLTHASEEHSNPGSEHVAHNKEQHQQSAYYKKLGEEIRKYDEVVLFGPTNAKQELCNLLRADHNFSKIKISVKQMDQMTENQQHAFVKGFFSKQ